MNFARSLSAFTLLGLVTTALASASDVGKRFPSEATAYVDRVTGLTITALTTSSANDAKIYQTHPQWSSDGKYVIFRSNRAGGVMQAFAVNEITGEIIQLTDGPGNNIGSLNLARKSMKVYFLRGGGGGGGAAPAVAGRRGAEVPPAAGAVTLPPTVTGPVAAAGARSGGGPSTPVQMIELNLEKLFADSEAGTLQEPAAYERICATLPAGMRDSGGFGLDANEKFAYIGVRGGDVGTHLAPNTALVATAQNQRMGAGPGGIRNVNLETGEIKVVIDTPFNMGHVQVNPWVPGEIIYCHETGGDAPQRMWTVMADGTGNRALYTETPDEWVTHETVVGPDEVMFAILAHQTRLQLKPSGLAVINLRTNAMKILGQSSLSAPDRGIWHVNGSPDGRWAVGDTFAGNLYLLDRVTSELTLLTTDHKMQPDHLHPTFSADSKRILVQSGHLSNGKSLDLMIVPVPFSLQNRR